MTNIIGTIFIIIPILALLIGVIRTFIKDREYTALSVIFGGIMFFIGCILVMVGG